MKIFIVHWQTITPTDIESDAIAFTSEKDADDFITLSLQEWESECPYDKEFSIDGKLYRRRKDDMSEYECEFWIKEQDL